MIENYLPKNSEYAAKVAAVLKPYEKQLYAIGSNARNKAYELSADVGGYDFVLDTTTDSESVAADLNKLFPNKTTVQFLHKSEHSIINCDCEVFNLSIRVEPLGSFLRSVTYAGDAIAVSVADDSLIVRPEFQTVPPQVRIFQVPDDSAQNDKEWVTKHEAVLQRFHDDIVAAVNRAHDEPARTK